MLIIILNMKKKKKRTELSLSGVGHDGGFPHLWSNCILQLEEAFLIAEGIKWRGSWAQSGERWEVWNIEQIISHYP